MHPGLLHTMVPVLTQKDLCSEATIVGSIHGAHEGQNALLWGSIKEEGGPLPYPEASRPTVAKVDMGWVPLEAACENRGDVTELDHFGGVWGYPMPTLVRALVWALSL